MSSSDPAGVRHPDHAGPITVLVTAIGGAGYGEQVLKALRLAGGYRIIGADRNPRCVNFALVDRAFTLPAADDPDYLDAVIALAQDTGALAVFNGCEPELRVMSEARERLAAAGLLAPLCPRDVIRTCMDKAATARFLQREGFVQPRTVVLDDRDAFETIDWYPVVVKPGVGSGGSVDCHLVQNPRELALLAALLGERSEHMVVQEYVGRPDAEFTVGVLHDLDGRFVNSIAIRRHLDSSLQVRVRAPNRTDRRELGDTLVISSGFSHGTIGVFPEVTETCERIAATLGVTGPVNIQCRLTDDGVSVFEINPRFSGTTSLRAMVGYNEPDVLLRHHLRGEDIEVRFPYRTATIHRSLLESFVPEEDAPSWRGAARALAGPGREHDDRA